MNETVEITLFGKTLCLESYEYDSPSDLVQFLTVDLLEVAGKEYERWGVSLWRLGSTWHACALYCFFWYDDEMIELSESEQETSSPQEAVDQAVDFIVSNKSEYEKPHF